MEIYNLLLDLQHILSLLLRYYPCMHMELKMEKGMNRDI